MLAPAWRRQPTARRRRRALNRPRITVNTESPALKLTLQPQPAAGAVSRENPPRFAWRPDIDAASRYALRVLGEGDRVVYEAASLALNFHTPALTLPAGALRWQCRVLPAHGEPGPWTEPVAFTLADDAVAAPGLGALPPELAQRAHPRLWLNPDEMRSLGRRVHAGEAVAGWAPFVEQAVKPWVEHALISEPQRYPDNQRTPPLWRQMYIDCQEILYAVRHLAVAGRVLDDAALVDKAKQWLLHAARFDVNGTTSRAYNDEAAFRIAGALAWGYDWLHDQLDDDERAEVRRALSTRLEEVAGHVIDHARIHLFPYDSHAVRSVASVIVPACIALLGEHPRAQEWLQWAVDYYDTLYSPWGGADGGWAEGPHYWTTAMAYFTEAANLLKKFSGHDLYRRVFFRHTGYFPLYTKAPDTRRACFGDDSTLGDLPSLKVGYNVRQYAAVTGDGHLQWYFERIRELAQGTEHLFYNHGWWSFAFDDLCFQHDWPAVPAREPAELPPLRHFADVGWVALQHRLHEPDEHLQFVTKCSPYGSLSHSHGDQGAFLLYAYGEELAIQSGYYIGHGTSMHRQWRRLTKSKNAILIDGRGQYAGADKALQIQSAGRVLAARHDAEGSSFISVDPSAAYRLEVPTLRHYRRDFHWIRGRHLVVVDDVELDQPGQVQWLMQLLAAPQLGSNSFRHEGERGGITGEILFSLSGQPELTAQVGFDDVDPAEIAGLAPHHRVVATTPSATRHQLVTLLTPYKKGTQPRLLHFIDDQGFATHLYLMDELDRSYSITLPKNF